MEEQDDQNEEKKRQVMSLGDGGMKEESEKQNLDDENETD